jgi:hypothetical protein
MNGPLPYYIVSAVVVIATVLFVALTVWSPFLVNLGKYP